MRRTIAALVAALACAGVHAGAATPQDVSFRTDDGVSIAGSLYLAARPGPAVILLHMLTRTREDWQPVKLVLSPGGWLAEPIFGKSNLIFTLVAAVGLIKIHPDANGISAGEMVEVFMM